MRLTRRGFFGGLAGLVVAARARVPRPAGPGVGVRGVVLPAPRVAPYAGIERSVFPFWRTRVLAPGDPAGSEMTYTPPAG